MNSNSSNSGSIESYNHLKDEKSPYLLQHATNPVDWYPWFEEAFEKAQQEDKPIFLSIGYSTCHWCHVMAHESFEDPEIAELMNDTFVAIKVDREERPDIDSLYMQVCTMLTGRGGWPLTIIMDADKRPFFAGTYFPKESRYGRIGLKDLIKRIADLWQHQRSDLKKSSEEIITSLQEATNLETSKDNLNKTILDDAYLKAKRSYDSLYGGFSQAPKFPSPHKMLFLLRYWKRTGLDCPLEMVDTTLTKMRQGGVFDHLGFGFHRYSTDAKWLLPHFEKMLYDQALLALVYTEAFQATKKELYRQTVIEILEYVQKNLLDFKGGFYSAQDADSEGEEGKYYTWSQNELESSLTVEEMTFVKKMFHLEKEGNFLDEANKKKTNLNVLHMNKSHDQIRKELDITESNFKQQWAAIRMKLLKIRQQRIPPHTDDKILTDWNGLMIAAFAIAGRVFDEESYIRVAENAAGFILKMMFDDGRLYHRYRQGDRAIKGLLDDYAFTIWGLLELYESTFKTNYLKKALSLQKLMDDLFWDKEQKNGYFLTPKDGEELLIREKTIYDGAIPSGNSVAVFNLIRLSRLQAKPELEEKAMTILTSFAEMIKSSLLAFTMSLVSLEYLYGDSYEFVFVGDLQNKKLNQLLKTLYVCFIPHKVILHFPLKEEKQKAIKSLTDFVEYKTTINDQPTVYVCKNKFCKKPTNEPEEMIKLVET
jgi:hypothetical protein